MISISAFNFNMRRCTKVFECLLQQSEDNPEFYLSAAPSFVGKTFGEAWRMLPEARRLFTTSSTRTK
jgi:hypothetical protein